MNRYQDGTDFSYTYEAINQYSSNNGATELMWASDASVAPENCFLIILVLNFVILSCKTFWVYDQKFRSKH